MVPAEGSGWAVDEVNALTGQTLAATPTGPCFTVDSADPSMAYRTLNGHSQRASGNDRVEPDKS
jgi:hypothetical protein